ncbi:rod shape-determining protein MreB [Lacticaseibacillus rhamnosus 2166]|nr:rod shape-determining protein MreB [Lacticaseibacillus rhamnosus 2166]
MICAPTNITDIEQKAIIQAAEKSGGRHVYLEFEPKVAAVGAGLDIFQPQGNMVIDIGGGTSDIAVLSLGEIVTSRSLRLAGDKMDASIAAYVKNKHKLIIGEHTAEQIKIKIGAVYDADPKETIEVRGRDIATGLPREVSVTSAEVSDALHETMMAIIDGAKGVLEKTPPELSADIIDRGIMLTGGGALLKGISQLFADELKVPVLLADDPLDAVALGTGVLLDNIEHHRQY